jgi:hypothetical protein
MKVTISYKQELGQQGELFVALDNKEAVSLERGNNFYYVSTELTNSTSNWGNGIFVDGSNKFFRPKSTEVEVDLADLEWSKIVQSDVDAVAAYIAKAVDRVKSAFNEKYPLILQSASIEI